MLLLFVYLFLETFLDDIFPCMVSYRNLVYNGQANFRSGFQTNIPHIFKNEETLNLPIYGFRMVDKGSCRAKQNSAQNVSHLKFGDAVLGGR